MNTTRYVLGVLLIVGLPPAVAFWLLVHPLAEFWRKLGPVATYAAVGSASVALGGVAYRFRGILMGVDLGTNWLLIVLGILLYVLSAWISVLTRRQLDLRTFVGLPEILGHSAPDVLLQDGIYGRVRHPRYLSVIVGTVGFALFINFSGPYLMVLASVLALLVVVGTEERELARRFGAEYDRYRARVPGLIPRFSRSSDDPQDRL